VTSSWQDRGADAVGQLAIPRPRPSRLGVEPDTVVRDPVSSSCTRTVSSSAVLTERAAEEHVSLVFAELHLTDDGEVSPRVRAVLVPTPSVGRDRRA
jgi:hypothetical protein